MDMRLSEILIIQLYSEVVQNTQKMMLFLLLYGLIMVIRHSHQAVQIMTIYSMSDFEGKLILPLPCRHTWSLICGTVPHDCGNFRC
nr:MAG TPA: hypothetical protein [Caudoviricetes sp.]